MSRIGKLPINIPCSVLVLPFILRYITGKNDGAAQAPLRGAF